MEGYVLSKKSFFIFICNLLFQVSRKIIQFAQLMRRIAHNVVTRAETLHSMVSTTTKSTIAKKWCSV